jgi:alginate O-acetyltransferase complex protein AlgI
MAIGLCKMFGFRLNENFNYPYISRSITEFWRRWHISLSTWFKEYLYIPLGGNRRGNVYLHLFIVFCATGIWHGAAWQFLAWGLWHGAFILIEKYAKHELTPDGIPKYASVVPHYAIKALRWFTTMLVVYFGWLLFSADGIHHAFDLFRTMFGIEQAGHVSLTWAYYFDHKIVFTLIIAAIGATPLVKTLGERWTRRFGEIGRNIGRIVLFACLIICVLSAVGGTYSPFIYFRF